MPFRAGGRFSVCPHSGRYPQLNVISDLAPHIKKADYVQGASGTRSTREKAHKLFVVKILTSKSLRLKILQGTFAKPAPVKAFRGEGGGGVPHSPTIFPKRNSLKRARRARSPNYFFGKFPQAPHAAMLNRECTARVVCEEPCSRRDDIRSRPLLAARFHFFFFLAGLFRIPEPSFADPFFPPNTRAKILSTFFSWRGRSKAYSICLRGTLSVISLSARTS